jgi:subtilisin family serine protease
MPRTGSPHTHRGAAVAAVLLAAFAATSLARGVEEVVPGQKLFGEIEPAKDLTIVLRVVDGTQLSLSAKARKGSSLRPLFSLRDPDGGLVAIDEFVKGSKKGNAAKLKKLPIELGGAYQLTILGDFNSTGEFDLATSAKFPTKDKGVAEVVTADQVVAIEFDGLPGDVVQLKLGKAKKSDLSASILRYVEEGGTTTEIGEPKKSGKHTVGTTGRHRFEISGTDGTTGQFKYLLKIKRAKAPKDKRDLAELDASGTITGRIVLDGDVSRESVPGKRAARTAPSPTSIEGVRAGEIIVGTPAGVGPNEAHAFVAEEIPGVNFEVVRGMTDDGPYLIRVPDLAADPGSHATRRRTVELAAQLDASPVVRYAEVNRLVTATKHPSDVRWPEQYDMRQMNLPEAWDIETGSSAVVIAIVDTGIWPHPDLGAKVINGYDFVSSVGDAFDGNGWDSDPTDHARDFHGTHVAGTAAASTNNGSGVAGVAWGCRVLPVRVLGASGGTYFDIAAGLRWAVGLPVNGVPNNPSPADVVNMSLGGESPSSTMSQAVRDASATGAVLVAASGNNASNVPFYPASYPEVISIYALDSNLHWASYSNWGSTIDLGAPGGDLNAGLPGILSTYVDGSLNATYTQLQGTSMASPHIAGVVALMRSADPAISASEIRKVLIETAVDLGPAGFDEDYGHGMVDAFAALEKITPAPQAPPTLRINPSALKFGKLTDERRVYVRNAGSGEVTLNRIQ